LEERFDCAPLWHAETRRDPSIRLGSFGRGRNRYSDRGQAGIPTLGIPGKATWKSEWAELLHGLEVVLWVEPDAESLVSDVMKAIPDLKVIQAVPPIKDINQALTLGMDVAQVLKEARDCSVVEIDFLQQLDQELLEKARAILESRDPLERVREAISAGEYGGDISKPLIVYLALTSRLIKMGELEVPTAEREPLRMMLLPASALTVTPGSMVSVTPLSIVI
jgi:hypothetical protein